MVESKGSFQVGKRIWPGISNVGGNASNEDQEAIRQLITEFTEYMARTLENSGIPRFVFPLFKPFNAVFGITNEQLFITVSPLSGGLAILRFQSWRDMPTKVTLEQATRSAQQQLGWTQTYAFSIPIGLLYKDTSKRQQELKELADNMSERIKVELQRQQYKARMQPIFRTPVEEVEIDSTLCFVLMPFSAEFDRIYKTVIKEAIEQVNLNALRADEIFSTTPIVEDIWTHIAKSRIVIADVTDRNPNVFYELGLAHAIGRPVIILSQRKMDVPFDIAYMRYILYADDQAGWQKLKNDLASTLLSVLK